MALLRMAARFTEKGMGSYEIRYIRDREKREVDFILVKDNEPVALLFLRPKKVRPALISRECFTVRKWEFPCFKLFTKPERSKRFQ